MKINIILLLLFIISSCSPEDDKVRSLSDVFKEYLFDGRAEIISFDLQQARYGEIHEGHAVMIFVSEPFSREKQVKLDNPEDEGINVMKLNFIRKFTTGIYPYSTMLSTFCPLTSYGESNLLKMTFSSQEWCGQVFSQLNNRSDGFMLESFSYFEKEGDQRLTIPVTITEDELWTRIRLNPMELPQGKISILPSMMASRLQHFPMTGQQATASFSKDSSTAEYRVEFEDDRILRIYFEPEFPNAITGWDETTGGLTTRARKRKSLKLPYWQLNKNKDQIWRDSLDLK
jgi:hypothetical protein